MIKYLLLILCVNSFLSYSQISITEAIHAGKQISKTNQSAKDKLKKRWFSTAEIEIIITNEIKYDYGHLDDYGKFKGGRSLELDNKASFGGLYSLCYPILKKISLGGIGGIQYQVSQKISALKLGGILRYHFGNYSDVNMYLMYAYNIALSNNINSASGNIRLGLTFPIKEFDALDLILNVFWDYNFYEVQEPLFFGINEDPKTLTYRAYGVSIGIKF